MNPSSSLPVRDAWKPISARDWTPAAARHLLRRAGWAATPTAAQRAYDQGINRTLDELFPASPADFPAPPRVAELQTDLPELTRRAREADSPKERQDLQREARERSRRAEQDLALMWLDVAHHPARAAAEKWIFFLSDVYVVSSEKVRQTNFIWEHHDILRRHAFATAPELTKAVSRSPAMILYLDLQNSRAAAPNENFARELFELFVLGEGNYHETDIKEAARAFTGYRQEGGMFRFVTRQHDAKPKTIFGETGRFDGDAVIDLAYRQPAAATFLPRELIRFYLTEGPIDEAYVEELGHWWAASDFDLRSLARHFFRSQLFHDPVWRGARIKSPIEFYLGLTVDLELDVPPLPRTVLSTLRLMGQELYQPPNVRGWVGGRRWINAGTLNARRQLVQFLLTPLDHERLNADEIAALNHAREAGHTVFTVDDERLQQMAEMSDEEIASRFTDYFLPVASSPDARATLVSHLSGARSPEERLTRIRDIAVALLQSPAYQLC